MTGRAGFAAPPGRRTAGAAGRDGFAVPVVVGPETMARAVEADRRQRQPAAPVASNARLNRLVNGSASRQCRLVRKSSIRAHHGFSHYRRALPGRGNSAYGRKGRGTVKQPWNFRLAWGYQGADQRDPARFGRIRRRHETIRKAVFPVAGLGTRFLPATKAMPKEMLPVVDRPLIQHVVDEAREAGIEHFIFVTGRNKGVIEDHFDRQFELEHTAARATRTQSELELWRATCPAPGPASFTRQQAPLGLGHAVWCARELVGGEPFALLLPDVLVQHGAAAWRR